jgi:hypothetical protein
LTGTLEKESRDEDTLVGHPWLFFVDIESKHIPNLAWSLSPYSNCAPDLVQVTHSKTLTANAWGQKVKTYLLSH